MEYSKFSAAALAVFAFFAGGAAAGLLSGAARRLQSGQVSARKSPLFCARRGRVLARHVIAGVLGGLLAALALGIFGAGWHALAAAVFMLGLLGIALFDAETMEIPDAFILALAPVALALALLSKGTGPLAHLIGAAAFPLPFFLSAAAIKDSFGGGDIKLAAVCGLALGWKLSIAAFLIALLTGGSYAAVRLLRGELRRGQHFAFGPCLALATAISLFWGEAIVDWYLSLLAF